MKKILFLHSSSELYGSDRSLLNLVKNLDREIFEIYVILPEEGPLVDEIKKIDNINLIIKPIAVLRRKNLNFKGLIKYIKDFKESIFFLKNIIRKNNIDVIYTNTSVVFPGGIIAKILKIKSIWHVREIISNKFERRFISIMINLFSDVIITNSRATANSITNNITNNKIKIIHNAIEVVKSNENNILIKDNNIMIGMAGRINRWKGQKLFIDMASQISKKYDNTRFLIAGDVYKGEDYILQDLKEYINEKKMNEKVILLGQVKDMNAFYNSLDIFILPSIKPEPFGLVIIEAMNRKIPVIATNHGGPVEIIDDGINGYLVDFSDCKEMSEKVSILIDNKYIRKEIGDKAKEKVDKFFTLKTYVNEIEKIISSI